MLVTWTLILSLLAPANAGVQALAVPGYKTEEACERAAEYAEQKAAQKQIKTIGFCIPGPDKKEDHKP